MKAMLIPYNVRSNDCVACLSIVVFIVEYSSFSDAFFAKYSQKKQTSYSLTVNGKIKTGNDSITLLLIALDILVAVNQKCREYISFS